MDNAVASGCGFGWTSHQSDYRPSCGSQCLNSNDLALEREQERGKLAFDDAGRARDSRMGQRGRLAGVHAEEGKDSLADAVRQQDARSQRRKDRTHQYHRITHRITGFIVTRFESVAMKL